jgi:hypothetical protein
MRPPTVARQSSEKLSRGVIYRQTKRDIYKRVFFHAEEVNMRKRFIVKALLLTWLILPLGYLLAAERPGGKPTYDVVIANGRVIDGTGNPWFYGDLAIKGGQNRKDRQDRSQVRQTSD